MSEAGSSVSVVVLSYDRPEYLRVALESIRTQTLQPLEVLVIDNPSPNSNRIAEVVAEFPGVRLVRNASNTGYTGGMNTGLSLARGAHVYLTEDDIVLAPRTLELLLAAKMENPKAGLLGAVITQHEEPEKILCAGGDVRLGGEFRVEHHHAIPRASVAVVTFLPGNSLLASTEFLRRLGGFRRDFFMYYEDVELCQRVIRLGHQVLLVSAARAGHIGATKEFSKIVSFHCEKNFAAVNLLHAPLASLPMFLLRYQIGRPLRLALTRQIPPRVVAKAWLWMLLHIPRLMADRWRMRALNRYAAAATLDDPQAV